MYESQSGFTPSPDHGFASSVQDKQPDDRPSALARALGATILTLSSLILLSLATWSASDPSLTHLSTVKTTNVLGALGAITADLIMTTLGIAGIIALLPPLYWAFQLLGGRYVARARIKLVLAPFAVLAFAAFLSSLPKSAMWPLATGYGGNIGDVAFTALTSLAAMTPTDRTGLMAALTALAAGLTLMTFTLGLTRDDLKAMAQFARNRFEPDSSWVSKLKQATSQPHAPLVAVAQPDFAQQGFTPPALSITPEQQGGWTTHHGTHDTGFVDAPATPMPSATASIVASAPIAAVNQPLPQAPVLSHTVVTSAPQPEPAMPTAPPRVIHRLPSTSLLAKTSTMRSTAMEMSIAEKLRADRLRDVLAAFAITGDIRDQVTGPVVTTFIFEPTAGIKTSRILGLENEIARSLGVAAVRLQLASGRSAVIIEVPHDDGIAIGLRDLVEHQDFRTTAQALPMAFGSTARGEPAIADLASMPSLLIAGGDTEERAGLLRALVAALAYRHTSETLTLALTNASGAFNAMTHLPQCGGHPAPVAAQDVINLLSWAAGEIDDRSLKLRASAHAKSIEAFNARTPEPMPYLVLVLDDLGALTTHDAPAVDYVLQRIVRDGAAVGVHLIAATDRVDDQSFSDAMRAVFPTRLALRLSGRAQSRAFLGDVGAEGLFGQGDTLAVTHRDDVRRAFGGGTISRLHTTRLDPEAAARVADACQPIIEQNAPVSVPTRQAVPAWQPQPQDVDGVLMDRAVALVRREHVIDTQLIRARLGIGYGEALSLLEQLARDQIVSAMDAEGRRRVLIGRAA